MKNLQKLLFSVPPRPCGLIFLWASLLALALLPACTGVYNVPLDYQPLSPPQKLGKVPVPLKVGMKFRSDLERETISFSIGNERFVMKLGEVLSAALTEAAQTAFQPPSEEAGLPPQAFLEFQLGAALVDAPKTYLGDILGLHDVKYRIEIKTFLSDPFGKEIWRGSYVAQNERLRVSTLFSVSPEKEMGKHLSGAIRKIGNDFITDVINNPAIAQYIIAAREERLKPKTKPATTGIRLDFALRPALTAPKRIGVVDLRPVEQAGALLAYDLSQKLRKELTSWGLNIYDPENTRSTHPEAYNQYWACDNLQCLTDAGRKMGYEYMIYGSVMKSQEKYLFTLRLLTTDPVRDPQIKVVSSEGNFSLEQLSPALKKLTESLLAAE